MCVKSKPTKTFTSTILVIQENHGDHDYYDGHHHDHDGNDGRDSHIGHQYPHLPEPYQKCVHTVGILTSCGFDLISTMEGK